MTKAIHLPATLLPPHLPSGFSPDRRTGATKRLPWIVRVLLTWDSRSRMRRTLADLPKWLLDDMGLSRDDVRFETSKFFWQA